MIRLKVWQWIVLALPLVLVGGFLVVAAGMQIHAWGLSWIWAVFTLIFVGWRWLVVKWTKPALAQVEAAVAEVSRELEAVSAGTIPSTPMEPSGTDATIRAEAALERVLAASANDAPIWEDLQTFWQRCLDLVADIANIYCPDVKYPLLNIYVPQAYGLIRGTVDDMDSWMQKLSPALNQVSIGQAYEAYEVYQKLEPSARKFLKAWNLAQWLLNPVAAVAKRASQRYTNQANQQLLGNLNQLLREVALRNLCKQAAALYGSDLLPISVNVTTTKIAPEKTQTLRDILSQTEPVEAIAQKPVSILLIGRTGAGKSSLINSLFPSEQAEVDVLPSTDKIQSYHWQTTDGEALTLWDTPGYEQVNQGGLRDTVLEYTNEADLLLLVTPALDPSLQMDADFLRDVKAAVPDLPMITIVTQVDKLRPLREWQPPYDWEWGEKPKEVAIREASKYRAELLGDFCDLVLPIVTGDTKTGRVAWGIDALSLALVAAINPAKQQRLARFLRDLDARTVAAAKIIDHYTFQMTTTQGLTALLKSPVLQFISTVSTGSPALAYLLAEKIPAEQLPLVIGKLQMAYELFGLLNPDSNNPLKFDLRSLWSLLLDNSNSPERNAWAFGQTLLEYWTQNLTVEQMRSRFEHYLQQP
ncbi:GTPase family protein [Calothrix sp. UHCC 0171]|uniref:GTPase family protein n=1 Tax=Calothrix sp. UHCC 0171 TaxID=3110245 RepID=UPI002B20557A|nr:GTPase family protein [Calothrix sp. UHCC 0171]MEA5572021.1 GTPase family protein [Calothrix sp. UHCC 0171]